MELHSNKYLTTAYSGDVSEEKIQELLNFVEKHEIEIQPSNIFSLKNIQEAHRLMESKGNIGKNIVMI